MPLSQRKSPRLKDYDYGLPGGYFVTICTYQKQHFFGTIKNAVVERTDVGQIAYEHWARTPEHFPQ